MDMFSSELRGASHRPVWNAWVARSYNPPAQSAGDRQAGRMSRDALAASFFLWHFVNSILCRKLLIFGGKPIVTWTQIEPRTEWFHDRVTLAWWGHEHVNHRWQKWLCLSACRYKFKGWTSSWRWRRSWGRGWLGTPITSSCTLTICKELLSEGILKVKSLGKNIIEDIYSR